MKPFLLLISVVIFGTASVAWVSNRNVPVKDEHEAAPEPLPRRSPNPLEIPEQGPYPSAVLEQGLHKFSTMQVGETRSHSFTVRNDGDAPLMLQAGEVTCKCTIPNVTADPVQPGESVAILLTWTPEKGEAQFYQRAQIWTNDPESEQLKLEIAGKVAWLLYPLPSAVWDLSPANEDEPNRFAGSIISTGVDDFQVLDHKCTVDGAQVEIEAMSPTELADKNAKMGAEIKSGYNINVAIEGSLPIGQFRERLTIVTDIEEMPELTVLLNGNVPGPYFILGKGWNGSLMKLNLGNVKASKGKTVTLSMFVPRQEEPMQLEVRDRHPEFLQVEIERNESFKAPTKERYSINLKIPPGSPVGSWQGSDIGVIRLVTNHQSIPELEMTVEMVLK